MYACTYIGILSLSEAQYNMILFLYVRGYAWLHCDVDVVPTLRAQAGKMKTYDEWEGSRIVGSPSSGRAEGF